MRCALEATIIEGVKTTIPMHSKCLGRYEVYVQAFVSGAPTSSGKWQISTNGGGDPEGRSDGRELY